MWIRTQDKKQLVDVKQISVERSLAGKKRFALHGTTLSGMVNLTVLGNYSTEEEAYLELDHIAAFIDSKDSGVYVMK